MKLKFRSLHGQLYSVNGCTRVEDFFAKKLKAYKRFPTRDLMYWGVVSEVAPIKLGVFELPVEELPTFFSDVFSYTWTDTYMDQVGLTISEWVSQVHEKMIKRMPNVLPDGYHIYHGSVPQHAEAIRIPTIAEDFLRYEIDPSSPPLPLYPVDLTDEALNLAQKAWRKTVRFPMKKLIME
jgi:hypothetical protein